MDSMVLLLYVMSAGTLCPLLVEDARGRARLCLHLHGATKIIP